MFMIGLSFRSLGRIYTGTACRGSRSWWSNRRRINGLFQSTDDNAETGNFNPGNIINPLVSHFQSGIHVVHKGHFFSTPPGPLEVLEGIEKQTNLAESLRSIRAVRNHVELQTLLDHRNANRSGLGAFVG
jgi:hypothetical protein